MTRTSFLDFPLEVRVSCYEPVLRDITVARLADREVWKNTKNKWQRPDRVIHQFKVTFCNGEKDESRHEIDIGFALSRVSRQVRQDVLNLMGCIPLELYLSDATLAKSAIRAMKFDYASSVEDLRISDEMIDLCRDLPNMMPRLQNVTISGRAERMSSTWLHSLSDRPSKSEITSAIKGDADELFDYLRDEIGGAGFVNMTVTFEKRFEVDLYSKSYVMESSDSRQDSFYVAYATDTADKIGETTVECVTPTKDSVRCCTARETSDR